MPEERFEDLSERTQEKILRAAKKARAQHEAWEASGLSHKAFDDYARFRQPLTPEEQAKVDEAMGAEQERLKIPIPLEMQWEKGYIDLDGRLALSFDRGAYMQIAMARAETQTAHVYPEEPGLMEKYPGIDPFKKCTEEEMAFAFRLEQVKAAMAVRPPEIQNFVKDVLADMGDESTSLGQNMRQVSNRGLKLRQLHRASKVTPDRSTSEHLEEEAFNMKNATNEMKWADRTIQTLESLVGLNDQPITDQQRKELADGGRDIPKEAEAKRYASNVQPESLKVEFANFEHERQYRFISDPNHWDKTLRDMPPDFAPGKEEAVAGIVSRYATATASRSLDGCFRQIEELTRNREKPGDVPMMNRGDLVTVDGMTIREHMERQYLNEHKTLDDFETFYNKNFQRQAGEIVSAGLMAGKRVEAFIPDKQGRIPDQPVQMTKTGYEPSPLKKVTLNAWERHFARRGFYKEKLARAEEYRRVMESRERVKTINDKQRAELQGCATNYLRNQIFGGKDVTERAMQDHTTQYSWSRGFPTTLAVCVMLAEGHSFEDIVNPDKLQKVKQDAAEKVIKHTRADDHDWIGRKMYDGFTVLADETDKIFGSFNVADPRQIQEHYAQVTGRCGIMFDLYQEVTHPGTLEGFMARAEEMKAGSSSQQEFDMEERVRALGELRKGMEAMLNSKIYYSNPNRVTQAELKDMALSDLEIGRFVAGTVTTQQFAQKMELGSPASRAIGGMEASALFSSATPTYLMDPVASIKDAKYRGKFYQVMQHLAAHDQLEKVLSCKLERQADKLRLAEYVRGEDGKLTQVPKMVDASSYKLKVDHKKFTDALTLGVKKMEHARRLQEQDKENTAEAEAKQEQKAAKQEQKAAKQDKKAVRARPAGRSI